jgi:hypothetical protein
MFTYSIEANDLPVRLGAIPQPRANARPPLLLTEPPCVLLSYAIEEESCALVEFWNVREFRSGYFNAGVLASHPLHERGLVPDGAFEICDSAWARVHETANRMQILAEYLSLIRMRHFAVTTPMSVFECLAERVRLFAITPNDPTDSMYRLKLMARQLGWDTPDM